MSRNTMYKMLNEDIGADKTVADDVYAEYVASRDAIHGDITRLLPNGLPDYSKPKRHSMFDELLKAVDKVPANTKELLGYLKHTHIFNFEVPVTYDASKLMTMDNGAAEKVLEDFYRVPLDRGMLGLPFANTCIVTPDAACMFNAIEGKEHFYLYTILVNMHQQSHFVLLNVGLVMRPDVVNTVKDLRLANKYTYVKKDNGKFVPFVNPKFSKYDASMIAPVIGKAMALLMQLNTPDRFIMEVAPRTTDIRSNKYVPRSHQRPEYVILHPHVIRHYMKTESEVEGNKRRGHERRAHLRRYPDDPIKFPKAHGKVLQIPALWIGSTEAVVGDKQYKVILN